MPLLMLSGRAVDAATMRAPAESWHATAAGLRAPPCNLKVMHLVQWLLHPFISLGRERVVRFIGLD